MAKIKTSSRLSLCSIFYAELTAWVVLGVSLLITLFSWQIAEQTAEQRAHERFQYEVKNAQDSIAKRMLEYEHVLRGAAGLFLASENVTRNEWQQYIDNLKINQYWPGIQGVGYTVMLSPEQAPLFTQSVRQEGYPQFNIFPEGVRSQYSSILYIEPFAGRNLRAFGYDMYAEPTRRLAMEAARDTGDIVISGKVRLVQENDKNVQPGFLMYLPRYKANMPLTTPEERRAALLGYVYAAFRTYDLMEGMLGRHVLKYLDFAIFDGENRSPEMMLYTSAESHTYQSKPSYTMTQQLKLSGHVWTLSFESSATLEKELANSQPLIIAVCGLIVDFLLFGILWSLARNRSRMLHDHAQMKQLLENLRLSANVFAHAGEAILITDANNFILDINPAFEKLTGYTRDEVVGKNPRLLQSGLQSRSFYHEMWLELLENDHWSGEVVSRKKDGSFFTESLRISVVRNHNDQITHFIGLSTDITDQKEYQQRLKDTNTRLFESEAQLNRAQEVAMIGSWHLDFATEKVTWSRETYRMFGIFPNSPLTTTTFIQGVHPDDKEMVSHAWQAALKGGVYNLEHRILVNGKVRWVHERAEVHFDENLKAIDAFGTVQDITERKAIELQLQQLSLAVEQSAHSIIITDTKGKIEYVNQGFVNTTGYQKNEVVGKTPRLLQSGLTPPQTYTDMWNSLLQGKKWSGELRNLRKGGEEYIDSALITPIRQPNGKITHFVAIQEDITEKRRLRTELDEYRTHLEKLVEKRTIELVSREQFIRALVDVIPGMVGYWNQNLRCEFANAAYLEWFEKTHEEIQGIHIRDLLGEATFNASEAAIYEVLRGRTQVFERTLFKADGSQGDFLAHYVPDVNIDGEVRGFFAIASDVTQVKLAERAQLEARNAEKAKQLAEMANQAKSDFIANMSHEIRTPMNAVMGLAQLLLDSELAAQQRNYLEKLQNASRSLLGILNDILDYSKIEAGKLELESIEFDLLELIDNTAGLFAISADEKDIELVFDIPPELPSKLIGDPLRIRQIINNLLGNAIKFTQQGHIQLSIAIQALHAEHLVLNIAVQDTGIGMTEEQLSKLFSAFAQADTSTTRKYGGTGLGLTICKRLVEVMLGEISVTSQVGVGSTFSFTLPLHFTPDAEQRHYNVEQLKHMRTLVIDDQEIVCHLMQRNLQAWSFDTRVCNDAVSALQLVEEAAKQKQSFELILLDWKLPHSDSSELIRQLRSVEGNDHALIIMLATSLNRSDAQRAAKDVKFDGVLEKPVLATQLYDLILSLQNQKPSAHTQHRWNDLRNERQRLSAIRGAKILVVEDNPTNQMIAREILEKIGLTVQTCSNGFDAIELARMNHYHAILMDVQMAGMNGLEATKKIRALPEWQPTPIIAMTASAMTSDQEACHAAGMNDFIAKPVDISKLSSVLLHWIEPIVQGELGATEAQAQETVGFSIEGLNLSSAVIRMGNDWSLLRKAISCFVRDFADSAPKMMHFIEQNMWPDAIRAVHTLKGVAKSIGADTLAEVAQNLEHELNQQRSDSFVILQQQLSQTLKNIQAQPDIISAHEFHALVIDRTRLEQLIQEMDGLLSLSSFVPPEIVDELKQYLSSTQQNTLYRKFKTQIESFDYPNALVTLRELAQRCKITLGG